MGVCVELITTNELCNHDEQCALGSCLVGRLCGDKTVGSFCVFNTVCLTGNCFNSGCTANGVGGSCSPNDHCDSKRCDFDTNERLEYLADGLPCDVNDNCDIGSYCVKLSEDTKAGKQCAPALETGTACASPGDRQSGMCITAVCQAKGEIGDSCDADSRHPMDVYPYW